MSDSGLAEEKFEAFDVDVRTHEFWFPSVYKPYTVGDVTKFGITFSYALIADVASSLNLRLSMRATPDPDNPTLAVRAQLSIAPEVVPVGFDWQKNPLALYELKQLLEGLDARNLSRDRVFHGRDLRLTVRPAHYHVRLSAGDREGHVLCLERVMVRMDQRGAHDYI